MQGTAKWFNGDKGFGFITPLAAARTCSSTSLPLTGDGYKSLDDNQRVELDTTQGPKGPQAENVRTV